MTTPPDPHGTQTQGAPASGRAASRVPFESSPWVAAVLLLIWAVAAGFGLGSYPLIEPDEGRNATAALSVLDGTGSWTLPHYLGLPLVDKPPLWFDLSALSMRLLGVSAGASRLPSLLAFAATTLWVGWLAWRLFGDRRIAATAAVAFATCPLILAYARIAIFDPLLTLFAVTSLAAGHQAVEGERPRRWAFLMWLALLLGALTKGPVALAWPCLVCLPYALWRRRASRLWSTPGVALLVAVLVPWLASVETRVPGFVRYAFLNESWERLTTGAFKRTAPDWYYLPVLIGGTLPWSVAGVAAWAGRSRGDLRLDRRVGYLLLWIGAPLLFFSFSMSKRLHYILPLLPAVALLMAAGWWQPRVGVRARLAAGASLLSLGLVLAVVASRPLPLPPNLAPDLGMLGRGTALALAVAFLGGGLSAVLLRHRPRAALLTLAGALLTLPIFSLPALRVVAEERSSRALAERIANDCPGVPIVGLEALPTSLPFYTEAPVGLASLDGEPFPSEYVRRRWTEVASREALFATSWWDDLPERVALVVERSQEAGAFGASLMGFELLGAAGDHLAYGRGCPTGY